MEFQSSITRITNETYLPTFSFVLRIAPEMLKLFHVRDLPRTPFRITPTPEASAATAPAAYYLAGAGDRPGTFYANCSELESRRMYECEVSDSGDYMWFWRGCEKYS